MYIILNWGEEYFQEKKRISECRNGYTWSISESGSESLLHVMEVIGKSDEESAGDIIDEPSGKSCRYASRTCHEITSDQNRQSSINIRLFIAKKKTTTVDINKKKERIRGFVYGRKWDVTILKNT